MNVAFFSTSTRYAVVGASKDRRKYGNRVLRWYQARNLPVTPINPVESEVEALPAVRSLGELGGDYSTLSLSVITPPHISLKVVKEALSLGVKAIWLQPGAEDAAVHQLVEEQGAGNRVILGGPCILVLGGDMLKEQGAGDSGKL